MRIITVTTPSGDISAAFPVDDAKEEQAVKTFEQLNGQLSADDQVVVKSWNPDDSTPDDAIRYFTDKGLDAPEQLQDVLGTL